MRKIYSSVAILLTTFLFAYGQEQPINWSYSAESLGADEYKLVFTAELEEGWYVYSQFLDPDEGPVPTSIRLETSNNYVTVGEPTESGDKKEGHDQFFDMFIVKFGNEAKFTQNIKLKAPVGVVNGSIEYMTCDDHKCLPPTEVKFTIPLN